ncbi:MAG: peptidase inhibitor family I36 protein [Microcoleus sp.]
MSTSVVIYQDANYEGASQELSQGSYDIGSLAFGNDQLSSLKVPQGLKVTLYEHGGFTGRTKTFTEDTPWVGDDFNDITSGITVEIVSRSTLSILEHDRVFFRCVNEV